MKSTFTVDLVAMTSGCPRALFPAWRSCSSTVVHELFGSGSCVVGYRLFLFSPLLFSSPSLPSFSPFLLPSFPSLFFFFFPLFPSLLLLSFLLSFPFPFFFLPPFYFFSSCYSPLLFWFRVSPFLLCDLFSPCVSHQTNQTPFIHLLPLFSLTRLPPTPLHSFLPLGSRTRNPLETPSPSLSFFLSPFPFHSVFWGVLD